VETLLADHPRHCVGQLDLAPRTLFLPVEHAHHFGLEDIAADHREVRRCRSRRRLLDQPANFGQRAIRGAGGDDAIAVGLVVGDESRDSDKSRPAAIRRREGLVRLTPGAASCPLGRKNHLFAGSDQDGHRWAIVCSLIESAKLSDRPADASSDVATEAGIFDAYVCREIDDGPIAAVAGVD